VSDPTPTPVPDVPPADIAPPFPVRVASIDVGSNAIRFMAVDFVDQKHWIELEAQRLPIRLGHRAFLTGDLDERTMSATVEAMGTFRRSLDNHGISRYRAVATSAVRDSRNGPELVERIRRETGIRLETITGTEEARLVWTAMRSRINLESDRYLTMDLGGGSLEISLISRKGIHWTESHMMGTVRILEELGGGDVEPMRFRRLLTEYAGRLRIPDDIDRERLAGVAATGGNIEALAGLAGCTPDAAGVSRLPMEDLRELILKLARMPMARRITELGLEKDRADVILPAALIYGRVAEIAGAREILVPHVGVKEGVLWDLAEDVAGPAVHASRLEQTTFHGALALGRRFQFDEPHARHVTRLALSLFDQLEPLHRLGSDDRRILLAAAALHDAGQFISYRGHHKHSLYLINNSDIPGLSRKERPLAALVARYHRRAEPKDEHFLYAEMDNDERDRVLRLSAILRLADALDRGHLQRTAAVRVVLPEAGADTVTLQIQGRGDLLLENWALGKKSRMFEAVFGRSVHSEFLRPDLGPDVI
jgi:exopolyphosphatase / guanosine-5'-triphosphate,3'-diphosphate pyrophosphatase